MKNNSMMPVMLPIKMFTILTIFFHFSPLVKAQDLLQSQAQTCTANSLATLKLCIQNITQYQTLQIKGNISCSAGECCPPGKRALLDFTGVNGLSVLGTQSTITRNGDHKLCSALAIFGGKSIQIESLRFNENVNIPPCQLKENCPNAVIVQNSSNIAMKDVHIYHAKSYAVNIWGVSDFTFDRGSLINSGILGFYVGHVDYAVSRRIVITNSTFADNVTNAIAIEGVTGVNDTDNLIKNNVFYRNHRLGIWPVDPKYGNGVTGGGQVYFAMGDHLTFQNNIIADGYCSNCIDHRVSFGYETNTAIPGIELLSPSHPYGFKNLIIKQNTIYNNDGSSISTNIGGADSPTIMISNNNMFNNGAIMNVGTKVQKVNNTDLKTQKYNGFELDPDFPSGWKVWNQCYPQSSAVRWCPGSSKTFYQNCVLRLISGPNNCGNQKTARGIFVQGMTTPAQPGQQIYLSAWVRNGDWKGRACIMFLDRNGKDIQGYCDSYEVGLSWMFHGLKKMTATAPAQTAFVEVQLSGDSDNGYIDLDNVRFTVGSPQMLSFDLGDKISIP